MRTRGYGQELTGSLQQIDSLFDLNRLKIRAFVFSLSSGLETLHMEPVKILYSGKSFKSVEKSLMSDEDKLATQAMAADIEAALNTLLEEIEEEGGMVTVDIKGPTMFQIATKGLSEKVTDKVHEALRPH
jgi:hypothetical protein